jgi:hypothetical protein
MKRAALIQAKRRGTINTHKLVLGSFRLSKGVITLFAIEQGDALNIIRPIQFTDEPARMYRWRTIQAASQFKDRHDIQDTHVVNVHWLDVLDHPTNGAKP